MEALEAGYVVGRGDGAEADKASGESITQVGNVQDVVLNNTGHMVSRGLGFGVRAEADRA